MTAEIVIMNREAVVLAADSAVTIGEIKTLNTANKVFMLIPGRPLGVLINNNPSLMGVPWEILIKSYRDYVIENNLEFPDLLDYATSFLKYIEENGSKFVNDTQEELFLHNQIHDEYGEILQTIWGKFKEVFYGNAQISDDEISAIVTEAIEVAHSAWVHWKEILPQENAEEFRSKLRTKFDKIISDKIESGFGNFSLSENDRNKLIQIALFKVSKRERKPNQVPPYTGIVFAGYGRDNLFPVCLNYEVHNYLCNTLVFLKEGEARIGFSEGNNTAVIIPFAQEDVVHNILRGRIPKYERELKARLVDKFQKEDVESILNDVHEKIWDEHTRPIIDTIDVLPKDELASVARTLVNVTSFMRHVSSDVETVGGPVDVAVISKKDGFIWIDRKHYFEIGKNVHFKYERKGGTHAKQDE